jgi:hypothetical protein
MKWAIASMVAGAVCAVLFFAQILGSVPQKHVRFGDQIVTVPAGALHATASITAYPLPTVVSPDDFNGWVTKACPTAGLARVQTGDVVPLGDLLRCLKAAAEAPPAEPDWQDYMTKIEGTGGRSSLTQLRHRHQDGRDGVGPGSHCRADSVQHELR